MGMVIALHELLFCIEIWLVEDCPLLPPNHRSLSSISIMFQGVFFAFKDTTIKPHHHITFLLFNDLLH
jgi:hypothetical protein